MHKQHIYEVTANERIARRTWRMTLAGDTSEITAPGQFVNIELEGKYLRRPISLCDYDAYGITLLYDVVGEGTEQMSKMAAGRQLNLLTALGNGFDTSATPSGSPLLVGGGIGVAPLLALAKDLRAKGCTPKAVLGFNTKADVCLQQELSALGVDVYVSTADGSAGTKGFVTDAIQAHALDGSYFYSCGPLPMLKALCQLPGEGQLSLDARMACGFGICMCCSLETTDGPKRICKEGPIFLKSKLIWK